MIEAEGIEEPLIDVPWCGLTVPRVSFDLRFEQMDVCHPLDMPGHRLERRLFPMKLQDEMLCSHKILIGF